MPTPFPSDELQAFPRYLPGTLCWSLIDAPENVKKKKKKLKLLQRDALGSLIFQQ